MKQFQLSKFDEFNGIYQVWFGNRVCVEFSSKRNMQQFLADTNRFLTGSMVELNEYYIAIFTQYRNAWFIMMSFKSKQKNLIETEQQLQKLMYDIQDQFNRAGNTYHSNSETWAFIHLQNICFMLNEAIALLVDVNKNRNNTYTYHSLGALSERIKVVERKICNYPEVLPANALGIKTNK